MADNTGAPHFIPYVEPTDLVREYPAADEASAFAVAAALDAAGGLVAVKSAIFTGTMATAVGTDGGTFAVTDLSITHALADASNKLIISAYFGSAGDSGEKGRVGLAVNDGTNFIGIGAADGARSRLGAGGLVSETGSQLVTTMPSVTFVHAPGDTSSRTYTVHAVALSAGTVFINRTQVDSNDPSRQRAASAFVIQEVKV